MIDMQLAASDVGEAMLLVFVGVVCGYWVIKGWAQGDEVSLG